MTNKFLFILSSRKFWAAFVALIMIFIEAFVPSFPFTADQIVNLVAVLAAYILGTAIEDAGINIRKGSS